MAATGTITLTQNSTSVSGSGTAFSSQIAVGGFIVATVGGTAYTLGIKTIDSDTALTLSQTYTGPSSDGLSFDYVPLATLNLITSALAAQVAYAIRAANLDRDNWQQIFTKTGDVTVNLPDNSTWTGPAWNGIATALANITTSLDGKAAKGANSDITSLTGLTTPLSLAQGGTGQKTAQAFLTAAGMSSTYNSFTLPFADRSMRVVTDSVVTTTNASGEGTLSYANSFANVCITCVPVIAYQSGISIMVINYDQARTTSFDYAVFNGTNRQTNSTVRISYIAIGF